LLFESNPGKIWQKVLERGFNTGHENQKGGFRFQTASCCHRATAFTSLFPMVVFSNFSGIFSKKFGWLPGFCRYLVIK
jgi:hypothetical protein